MELVFTGSPVFLSTIATVLPNATRESGGVETLPRDDTAFVCPMAPDGELAVPVYDSKAMFRGVQTNMTKTVRGLGYTDADGEPYMPLSGALGVSVWGSAWVIGSVTGHYTWTRQKFAAYDAFLAAYIVARSIPGVKRLVCPPLCASVGRISYQVSAAQIAKAVRDITAPQEDQQAASTGDSRGVTCYLATFNDNA